MILVHGPDEGFVEDVVSHLDRCGFNARGIPFDAHLFSEVVEHRAETVIGIAGSRHAATEQSGQHTVDALIAASNAPRPPRVVLVTPGPLNAPHVQALKRSGASYVVISSTGVEGLAPAPYLPRRRVWLSRQLLQREYAIVTEPALMCTIASAAREDTGTGLELFPARTSWRDALADAGVRVVTVPNWLARIAYWSGAPALFLETGRVYARLGSEDVAQALGALPSTAPSY